MNRLSVSKVKTVQNASVLSAAIPLQRKAINRNLNGAATVETRGNSKQQLEKPSFSNARYHSNYDFSKIPIALNSSIPIQAKLKIGQTDDKYEQEADRVAEQVMRMSDSGLSYLPGYSLQANGTSSFGGTIQRTCSSCSEEYKTAEDEKRPVEPTNLCTKCRTQEGLIQTKQITPLVQRQEDLAKEEGSLQAKQLIRFQAYADGSTAPPIVHDVLHSPGQQLDSATRTFMEPRFGHDFSRVRVHNDAKAAESAEAIQARAYTVGSDVVFGAGKYSTGTTAGSKLLAHELTHMLQQERTASKKIQRQEEENTKTGGGKTGGSTQAKVPTAKADPCGSKSKAKNYKPTRKGVKVTLGEKSFGNTSKLAADVLTNTFGACKVGKNWRFYLNKLTVKIGSKVQSKTFRQNVDTADDKVVTSTNYRDIINDLRPNRKASFSVSCAGNRFVDKVNSYSRRRKYWKHKLVVDHEAFHRRDWDAHYRKELIQAENEIWGHRLPSTAAKSAKSAAQMAHKTLTAFMIAAYQRTCKAYTPQQESRAYDAGVSKYQELAEAISKRAKREKW